jgi:hypothetical protein
MVNHTDPVIPTTAPIHEQDIHMESNISHTKPPKRQRWSKITFQDAQILADEFLDNNLKRSAASADTTPSENGVASFKHLMKASMSLILHRFKSSFCAATWRYIRGSRSQFKQVKSWILHQCLKFGLPKPDPDNYEKWPKYLVVLKYVHNSVWWRESIRKTRKMGTISPEDALKIMHIKSY